MRLTLLFLTFISCTPALPIPETTVSPEARDAAFPTLAPVGEILASARAQSPAIAAGDELEARAERLKARADLLRGRSVEDGQAALRRAP